MAEGQNNLANGRLVKGSGCGTREWREDFVLTDTDSSTPMFKVDRATGNVTIVGTVTAGAVVDGGGAVDLSSTLDVTGATTLDSTLAVAGASTLAAVSATTIAASGRIDSTVAAGSPILKAALTSDTPTVVFGADASHNPSTAPAGYLEILVGSSPRYIPVWA